VTDILITALVYFAVVFAAGFQLGTIRVLLLEPRIRAFVATLREAPFLLGAIVLAARWSPAATGLVAHQRKLVPIGLVALALQLIAEVVLGVAMRGKSIREIPRHFLTPEGRIYAVMRVLFAAMPWLVQRAGR
jgi:hypothetical protein